MKWAGLGRRSRHPEKTREAKGGEGRTLAEDLRGQIKGGRPEGKIGARAGSYIGGRIAHLLSCVHARPSNALITLPRGAHTYARREAHR